jgi:hypothetical protein
VTGSTCGKKSIECGLFSGADFFMVGKYPVTFGFLRGTSLPDAAGLLEGTGKNVRHRKLRTAEDLKEPALRKLIEAAAPLNKKEPMEKVMKREK